VISGSLTLKQHLRDVRENGDPEIHERVDLRAWTALGVGGLADLLIRCRSAGGLQRVVDLLATHGRRWLVLGAGSRLVPPNEGLRVPVINLTGQLALWELDLDGAVAGGGANLAQVSHAAARTGIPGLHGLMAAGGTVGGAVHAQGRGSQALDGLLDWVDVARPGAGIERIEFSRLRGTGAVDSDTMARRVVVRARLQLSARIQPTVEPDATRRRRRSTRQPRTAEIFFASDGVAVSDLLREAECGSLAVAGVRLSKREPKLISTARSSRASEVVQFVRALRQRVAERTGHELKTALCFVDEEGASIEP
jgi:UDP-N-acetylenolpyruvoylglucosamine reductase